MFCESHNRQHIYDLLGRLTGPKGYTHDYDLVKRKDTKEGDQAIGSRVLPHSIAQDVLTLFFLFYFCFVLRESVICVLILSALNYSSLCNVSPRAFTEGCHTGRFCVCEQLWLPKLQTPNRKQVFTRNDSICVNQSRQVETMLQVYRKTF